MTRTTRVRARLVALAGTALVGLALTSVGVSAKELTSGRGTVRTPAATAATATCNPVRSLGYKGDATTSDTAAATITVDYKVRACTGEPVAVTITVFETAAPDNVVLHDADAPAQARTVVGGVTANRSYIARVAVRSALDGTERGSAQIYVAAVPKGV